MKSGRLLLADRHLGMLGGLCSLLHDLFETVVMVADERSLLEAVAILEPEAVVVDLSLPGGEKAGLVGRLMQSRPGLRVVVLGVYDEPSVAADSLSAGAAGYVLKRAAAADLVPAVRAALTGGVFVSPGVRWIGDAPSPAELEA